MRQLFYISQSFTKVNNAGVKPSIDFENVLNQLGAINIGVKNLETNNRYLCRILNFISVSIANVKMPFGKIVFLQYPEQYKIQKLFHRAKKNNNKVVLLIHDLNELRGKNKNYPELLKNANAIIVHTSAMEEYVNKKYNRNTIVLNLFDYISPLTNDMNNIIQSDIKNIVFAGNLKKAPFLKKINLHENIILNVYGNGWENKDLTNVVYRGSVTPDELPNYLTKYNYGLVWDGDDINTCSGIIGEYLKYNSPYKISSYLSAGIPVIIWKKMGLAEFIVSNKLGVAVDSLDDISPVLSKISQEEYSIFRENAIKISQKLKSGEFYRSAIIKALDKINFE